MTGDYRCCGGGMTGRVGHSSAAASVDMASWRATPQGSLWPSICASLCFDFHLVIVGVATGNVVRSATTFQRVGYLVFCLFVLCTTICLIQCMVPCYIFLQWLYHTNANQSVAGTSLPDYAKAVLPSRYSDPAYADTMQELMNADNGGI